MPAVNSGEVWMTDFGMTAKVRPALLLTGNPAPDELDLVTVVFLRRSSRGPVDENYTGTALGLSRGDARRATCARRQVCACLGRHFRCRQERYAARRPPVAAALDGPG